MTDTLELCRWTYNETLATRKNAYEQEGESVSYRETKKLLPQWKEEKPELKGVHSQVLQEVVKRVDLAYQAFFRRVKVGEDPGYPRFKGHGQYDSFTYTQSGFSLKPGKIWLSKIGDATITSMAASTKSRHIKIKLHRAIEGAIQRLNIRRMPTGKWFVSFVVEVEPDEPLPKSIFNEFICLKNGELRFIEKQAEDPSSLGAGRKSRYIERLRYFEQGLKLRGGHYSKDLAYVSGGTNSSADNRRVRNRHIKPHRPRV
jgi:putative transposase